MIKVKEYENIFKNKYFLILLAICFTDILSYLIFWSQNNNIISLFDLYGFTYYCLDYSDGFITRGLAGTLFRDIILNFADLMVIDYQVSFLIHKFILICVVWLMIILGISYVAKYNVSNMKILTLICFHPMYITNIFYTIRTDMYWFISIGISVFLLMKDTKLNIKMCVITLLSIIAMLFHHAFIFVYAPLICLILIDKKEKKWFLIYGIILCVAFIVISLLGACEYTYAANTVKGYLRELGFNETYAEESYLCGIALKYEYEESRLTQVFSEFMLTEYKRHISKTIFLLIPLSLCSILTTRKIIKAYWTTENVTKFQKRISLTVILLPILALLVFTIDCDRWFTMILAYFNMYAIYLMTRYNIQITSKIPYKISLSMMLITITIVRWLWFW